MNIKSLINFKAASVVVFVLLVCQLTAQSFSIFPIGTKWWYEYKTSSQSGLELNTVIFEVVDTLSYEGMMASRISRNDGLPDIYIAEDNEKIYVFDYRVEDYVLTFDFDAIFSYPISYYFEDYSSNPSYDTILQTLVNIDNISEMYTGDVRGFEFVQEVSVDFLGNPAFGDTLIHNYDILEKVGFLEGIVGSSPFHWASDYTEYDAFWGKLRCFETPDVNMRFLPLGPVYPCDTSYLLTSTKEIDPASSLSIYPNPTVDILTIDQPDVSSFKVFDMEGKKHNVITINAHQFSTKSLTIGTYYLVTYDIDGQMLGNQRFIKVD